MSTKVLEDLEETSLSDDILGFNALGKFYAHVKINVWLWKIDHKVDLSGATSAEEQQHQHYVDLKPSNYR